MEITCDIIDDLLPFYEDGVCSDETRNIIGEHIAECEECRKKRLYMGEDVGIKVIGNQAVPIKKAFQKISARYTRKMITVTFIVSLIISAISISAFIPMVFEMNPDPDMNVLFIPFLYTSVMIVSLIITMIAALKTKYLWLICIPLFCLVSFLTLSFGDVWLIAIRTLPSIFGAVSGIIIKSIFTRVFHNR